MLDLMTRLVASPVFDGDDEKTRTASLLNTVSLVLLATQFVALFAPVYYGPTSRRLVLAGSLAVVTMMVQALISLTSVVVIAARAVNIL